MGAAGRPPYAGLSTLDTRQRTIISCQWGKGCRLLYYPCPSVHLWLPLLPVPRGERSANKKVLKQFLRTLNLSTRLFSKKPEFTVQNNWVVDNWRPVADRSHIRVHLCPSVVAFVAGFTRERGRRLLKSVIRTQPTRDLSVSSFRRNANSKRAVSQKRTRRQLTVLGGQWERESAAVCVGPKDLPTHTTLNTQL